MTIVSDNLKRVLRVTKSPNPDAVDGPDEAWKNPQGSTRPLAPVPTKPKECKCDEPSGISGQLPESGFLLPESFVAALKGEPYEPKPQHFCTTDEDEEELPNCLHIADRITSTDRNTDYGHPLDDYECTAALWTAILRHAGVLAKDKAITAELAIQCMIQVKLSREAFRHKDDNLIDAAGYGRCLEMVRQERERRSAAQ